MKVLGIIGKFREDILSGRKRITIRLPGKKRFKEGEAVRIDCGDKIIGKAVIKKVYRKKIKELTEEEIRKDGLKDRNELIKILRKLYERKISPETEVEIIEFELKEKIEEDFYKFHYGEMDIIEIARKGLEMEDLNEEEKEILRDLIKEKSIRKVALKRFGNLNKRWIIRKILRKIVKKLKRGVIIFDLDGTLVDTFEFHYNSFKDTFKLYGIEFRREELEEMFGMDAEEIAKIIFERNGKRVGEDDIKRFFEKKYEIMGKYKELIKLKEGVKEMLEYLKGKYKLAILSNSKRRDVEFILEAVGIKGFFDVIVSADDVGKRKPNPEGILKILKILGIPKENSIYVGDKEIDEETARRAGVKFYYIDEFLERFREIAS